MLQSNLEQNCKLFTMKSQATHLATHQEEDVFPQLAKKSSGSDVVYEDRLTGRGIILDEEKNVALVGTKVNTFYLLPGGGIHKNETLEEGVIRECLEEAGCIVTLEYNVGYIDDYRTRDKKHCITHCYIARVVGEKKLLELTEEEAANGLHVTWVPIQNALEILQNEVAQLHAGKVTFYNTGFNILRDALFIKKAIEILGNE